MSTFTRAGSRTTMGYDEPSSHQMGSSAPSMTPLRKGLSCAAASTRTTASAVGRWLKATTPGKAGSSTWRSAQSVVNRLPPASTKLPHHPHRRRSDLPRAVDHQQLLGPQREAAPGGAGPPPDAAGSRASRTHSTWSYCPRTTTMSERSHLLEHLVDVRILPGDGVPGVPAAHLVGPAAALLVGAVVLVITASSPCMPNIATASVRIALIE